MIDLPDAPAPQSATPIYVDFGGVATPELGGASQRINRVGNRFGLSVTMPPMKYAKLGRQWVARLVRAQSEGARMAWPLIGFDPGLPGSVLVDGAGQTGSTLNVKGATPNYIFREGQFFSIVTGASHCMYMLATETIADASGEAALPIAPMIRRAHADNDACHFSEPMIEGFVSGDSREWEAQIGSFVGLSFEIRERR